MLALPSFTVKELEYRIVSGCVLDDGGHDLKKCFAQSRRPTLRNMSVLRFKGTGLARRCIYTSIGHYRLLAIEAAYIADLCHELRPENRANAKHPHHDRVLWKLAARVSISCWITEIVSMIVLS